MRPQFNFDTIRPSLIIFACLAVLGAFFSSMIEQDEERLKAEIHQLATSAPRRVPPGWTIKTNGEKYIWEDDEGKPSFYSWLSSDEAIQNAWDERTKRTEEVKRNTWRVVVVGAPVLKTP